MANKLEFPRGDGIYGINFYLPVTSWSAGGTLLFAAKPAIDDDVTDANAVINMSWTDSNIVGDVTKNGILCKQYNCYFPPAATSSIPSNGADSADYLAEFKYIPSGGVPITFPPNDPKLDAIVYFNVKVKDSL